MFFDSDYEKIGDAFMKDLQHTRGSRARNYLLDLLNGHDITVDECRECLSHLAVVAEKGYWVFFLDYYRPNILTALEAVGSTEKLAISIRAFIKFPNGAPPEDPRRVRSLVISNSKLPPETWKIEDEDYRNSQESLETLFTEFKNRRGT